jgi:plasmid stabilization system protein ParE
LTNHHKSFPDLCLLYGDFNRPVFLRAIREYFIASASPSELKSLRRVIRDRAASLRCNPAKGRPRAERDPDWMRRSAQLAWLREIGRKSWRQIASAMGIKPTSDNIRTLQKRRDHYAMLVWQALPGRIGRSESLSRILKNRSLHRLLQSRLALPFDTHPQECKKIVRALSARGLEVAANELSLIVNRSTAPRSAPRSTLRK